MEAAAVGGTARLARDVRAGEMMEAEAVLREVHDLLEHGAVIAARRVDSPAFVLTPREGEVLRGLGEGLSDRELAVRFGISAKTASVHVANVKAKLGVRTRLDAAIAGRALTDSSITAG
jgi:DNA-binding CsgD family transcriptional regulator